MTRLFKRFPLAFIFMVLVFGPYPLYGQGLSPKPTALQSHSQGSAKKTIGRLEKVDFPTLGLFDVAAKVDTGARTSSIHCHSIKKERVKGVPMVHFQLFPANTPDARGKFFRLPIHDERIVKSSFGSKEQRIFIKVPIRLFEKTFDIELSLTDRSTQRYPMLLGRKAIQGRFLVDVSKTNQSFKQKKKKMQK